MKQWGRERARALVLGIGNILLGDEGVGVRVIELLQSHYWFSEEVQVLDGGTMSLDLIPYLEVEQLLVVDAVETGHPPGTIVHLSGDAVPSCLNRSLTPHEIGLADLLSVARLRGLEPPELALIGIQPASLDVGIELSPEVCERLPELVDRVIQEVSRWGYRVEYQPVF